MTSFGRKNKTKVRKTATASRRLRHGLLTMPNGGLVGTVELVVRLAAIVLLGNVAAKALGAGYDNDIWFIMATGRHIAEHGIPYVNPFAATGKFGIIVQQWLVGLVDWLVYDVSGWLGLDVLLTLKIVGLVVTMLVAVRQARHDTNLTVTLVMMVVAFVTMTSYISFRPQILTMMLMFLTIAVMERYRKRNDPLTLLLTIPICLVNANVHMSMAPMQLAIVACYLLPSADVIITEWRRFKKRFVTFMLGDDGVTDDAMNAIDGAPYAFSFAEDAYRRSPIAIILVAMAVTLCINPYGLNGAMYLAKSYGTADYGSYINEMGLLTPLKSTWGTMLIVSIILGFLAIGTRGRRAIDMPLTVMMIGTWYFSMQHVRSVWTFAVFSFVMCCKAFGGFSTDGRRIVYPDGEEISGIRRGDKIALCVLTGIIVCCMVGTAYQQIATKTQYTDNKTTPIKAVETLDSLYETRAKRASIKVCTLFNAGGFVEFHGYKVSMDPRPELWQSAITGDDRDRYSEYVNSMSGDGDATQVLEQVDFDYLIVDTGSNLEDAVHASGKYVTVMTGNGYVLWGREGAM